MAGTREGGIKTRETNYERHGRDHYRKIGAIGGRKGAADGIIKGFALSPERARLAGQKGGRISKRGKSESSNNI